MPFPRHHGIDTGDFEPHDTFVENLPALSANALGFVMGHQALPLSQIQSSTASGLPAEVLYPANGTKSIQTWKIIKKIISNHFKKKMHFHLQIFRPPWDPPTSVDQCKPQRWRVGRVSLGEIWLPHWHATSARFIEVAQGSIFSDSAWIPMDIRQKHIKTTKNTWFFFLHFSVLVSKVCPRRNWKNTGYVSAVSYIPWKDWVQSKMM